ncbi:hypothetical protein E2C01_073389 [Portunus trituberculatus]|uniref:Uncharacterized protein n=1 Tax=Portunus trituberculatus TaxID=210409 RepID=A0A5B7IDF1_PORTR|nr:hypothetical protein [Portunus trituberculatus]
MKNTTSTTYSPLPCAAFGPPSVRMSASSSTSAAHVLLCFRSIIVRTRCHCLAWTINTCYFSPSRTTGSLSSLTTRTTWPRKSQRSCLIASQLSSLIRNCKKRCFR